MRRLIVLIGAALAAALPGQAKAQFIEDQIIGTFGERSEWLSCFYECKPYFIFGWQEITTLMLTNPTLVETNAQIVLLDGNQTVIAETNTLLEPVDLDEVNVCRTLRGAGILEPQAGLVLVRLPDIAAARGGGAGYAWVKNLWGFFGFTVNEPFNGVVTGGAKTECRQVAQAGVFPDALGDFLGDSFPNAPLVDPVLIENTGE